MLTLTVVGAFGYSQLGVDRFPKVDFPTIMITTRQPGAAPEQIETEVSDKIEEAVNTISGLDELRSTSAEGVSLVTASFLLEKDVDVAAQEVRDKVNRILPLLPRTILQPVIEKMDMDAAPVLGLAVSAPRPVKEVTEYADKVLRRRLETVTGVGQVLLIGGRGRQINLWLDPDRLRAYNLTVTEVSRALQAQNVEVPGGRLEQGPQNLTVRTRGRVQSVEQFGQVVVRVRDGHAITVADVASIEDGMADAATLASVNGSPAVVLNIRRQSGTNAVQVIAVAGQGPDRGTPPHAAAWLRDYDRPRPGRLHQGVHPCGAGRRRRRDRDQPGHRGGGLRGGTAGDQRVSRPSSPHRTGSGSVISPTNPPSGVTLRNASSTQSPVRRCTSRPTYRLSSWRRYAAPTSYGPVGCVHVDRPDAADLAGGATVAAELGRHAGEQQHPAALDPRQLQHLEVAEAGRCRQRRAAVQVSRSGEVAWPTTPAPSPSPAARAVTSMCQPSPAGSANTHGSRQASSAVGPSSHRS